MTKLIVIRGNSGSGKTTVARTLQHKLGNHTMLISQDVVRREMLYVKDGSNTLALPMMKELLTYGRNHCNVVILEGILNSQWYKPLFEQAVELFGDNISAYYYDLPFEETLLRHQTKDNKDEFGETEMKKWWHAKDFIGMIPEKVITPEKSLSDTVEMIYQDIFGSN